MTGTPKAPFGRSASQRQPSLRGVLMTDTVKGQLRVRAWPTARGKPKSQAQADQQEWFRQVQKAANYVAPDMMLQFYEATQGTPLLPRDILTHLLSGRALMFVLPDGRKMYPMIFRNSVEEALDAITQTPGDLLLRTEEGWRGVEFQGSGGLEPGNAPDIATFTPWASDGLLPTWDPTEMGYPVLHGGTYEGVRAARGWAAPPRDLTGDFKISARLAGNAPSSSSKFWGIYVGNRAANKLIVNGFYSEGPGNIYYGRAAFVGDGVARINDYHSMNPGRDTTIAIRRIGNDLFLENGLPGQATYDYDKRSVSGDLSGQVDEIGIVCTHREGGRSSWTTDAFAFDWGYEIIYA